MGMGVVMGMGMGAAAAAATTTTTASSSSSSAAATSHRGHVLGLNPTALLTSSSDHHKRLQTIGQAFPPCDGQLLWPLYREHPLPC